MNINLGQVIILIIVIILLFGDFSKIIKNFTANVKHYKTFYKLKNKGKRKS